MRGRPLSTRAQRKRVFELADAGLSQRAIAEEVFGDRRLKNRVLRLLRRRRRVGGLEGDMVTLELTGELPPGADARIDAAFDELDAAIDELEDEATEP